MGILWEYVRDEKGATRRIGLYVILLPGLQKHTFSVEIGLTGGFKAFFSHNKGCYPSTPKFKTSSTSEPKQYGNIHTCPGRDGC